MAKYRNALPQLNEEIFLSDGGMETTLIFHEGMELPHFASFVLLETDQGRRTLAGYYENYLTLARERGAGFILDSATWRANPDWGARLGYDAKRLEAVNRASITLLEELRDRWETADTPCVIGGVVGPRGDGYKTGNMDAQEAEAYHELQVAAFAATGADMVSAYTLTNPDEAVGIARAARKHGMPCMISFTLETDGRLVGGQSLAQAIEHVDRETGAYPAYFMINCAHPTHFMQALEAGEPWTARIRGVKANASAKSHEELDGSATLDRGDPEDLARRYHMLRRSFPTMRILGGCCGTDHGHIAAICEACMPPVTQAAE